MSKAESSAVYGRVLIKLSGEALNGSIEFGIDPETLQRIAKELHEVTQLGVQVGLVIGGGNLVRGWTLSKVGLDRVTADHMGMLATVMNALAKRDALEQEGVQTRVMSAIPMSGLVDHYDRRTALHHLSAGRVVIFAAGPGNPLVTTDSAASLRGIGLYAAVILKGTSVDGVYTSDPAKDKTATLYESVSFDEALDKELGVMDLAAFCQCRDYNMPIRVFNINKLNALLNIMKGNPEGTLVDRDAK